MKRLFSLLLALTLLAPMLLQAPITANAATSTDEIRAAVTKAYDEILKTLNPGEGSGEGVMQLVNHAMSGGGKDLIMDEKDYVTGLVFNSEMFRAGFIEDMTAAFERLLRTYDDQMLLNGIFRFYSHDMRYYCYSVSDFGDYRDVGEAWDAPENVSPSYRLETLVRTKEYTGPRNGYDEGMMLASGFGNAWITIQKTNSSESSMSYHVSVRYLDNFDITYLDYKGDDDELARAIALLGKLGEVSGIIQTFHWECNTDFNITFGNTCPHQTENFRWEHDGAELAAVSGNGLAKSDIEHIDHYHYSTGEHVGYYYKLGKTVRLNHNLPWVVEVKSNGTSWALSPASIPTNGLPYLQKYYTVIGGAEAFPYKGVSSTTGKETTLYGRNMYGIGFEEAGIKNYREHVWRLENRVSGGSNMVYLSVDGQDYGPMNQYYIYKNSTATSQQKTVDWFNGKDIDINFIFNTYTLVNTKYPVSYIQIWENGEGNAPHSYYYTKTVAPTCTGKGYVSHICSQCGDTWNDNFVDALGHKLGTYNKKNDKLHSRTCTVCGEELVDVHDIKNNACTLCDYSAVKSVAGTWTTDLTLSAAELGVSAPDSVLRATLTFTDEGKATADWEAVDLTALRIFFRDMFVSSYYAMAYGSGITDIAQIEQFCLDSTGMSVSGYMDTIVTDEAMKAAFTPKSTQGTYRYSPDQTTIFTDLALMEVPSDPNVPNSFTVGGGTLYLNANSWGKPDYTFVCKTK